MNSEAYCQAFTKCFGIQAITLRFFNVYGPKNENSPYSGVITKFISKANNNQPLTVEGDGEQTRDFIHVNDVAQALFLALKAENVGGEVFNICTGKPTSINNLVNTLKIATGKNLQVTAGPPRISDIRFSYGDATKAKEKLRFKAKTTLQEGITHLIANA